MIGALIGSGLGIAGSIFGGLSAARQARRAEAGIRNQKADNTNWFNRRYNEDATARADAQRVLTLTEQRIRQRNRDAAGRSAVIGGTQEAAAATKQANANAMAQGLSSIAASGAARKDSMEESYRNQQAQLQGQLNGIQAQRAQSTASAIGGVASAAAAIGSAFDAEKDQRDENKRWASLYGKH